uniref:Uncharacterized protein n=1 Tax=Lepeophtheirus salmonis TaxID=72036 RepID=A0A0K2U061_LEPSM
MDNTIAIVTSLSM